jgi:hypothetical protein
MPVWYQSPTDSFFSIAERERIHHAAQKRKTVTRPKRQGGEKKRQADRESRTGKADERSSSKIRRHGSNAETHNQCRISE